MAKVLVVDDEPAMLRVVMQILAGAGHEVRGASSGDAASAAVLALRPDCVMLDLHLGAESGLDVLERLGRDAPGVPVVIMTGLGSIEAAVDAFKRGAADFVTKPLQPARLLATVSGLLRDSIAPPPPSGPTMVGASAVFGETLATLRRFARPDINVLLQGETGTGKELLARALHAGSKRSDGPFVAVDCSILSEHLLESELFGHEKGAFTGAIATRIGHFERADGGTLFLDEIGNLPLHIQAKLLRVLQERTLERVGGRQTLTLDLRVLSATNVELRDAVQRGAFRADLYYRLAEMTIHVPPLHERAGDVDALAAHFLVKYAERYERPAMSLAPAAAACLRAYGWPGNVRELENAIKSAMIAADKVIGLEHLPPAVTAALAGSATSSMRSDAAPETAPGRVRVDVPVDLAAEHIDLKAVSAAAVDAVEREVLARLLEGTRGSRAELARRLGVDPKTLRAKLRRHGL